MNQEVIVIPRNMHLITENPNDFMLLSVMMGVRGDNKSFLMSLSTLQRMMKLSRPTIVKTIQSLLSKGYIAYKRGEESHLPNEYIINMAKINTDIALAEEELQQQVILEAKRLMGFQQ